ncbi:DUF6249 domain-containing protein [Pseudobacter ginsenosidimutans]|uniref:DUF6249 domain-containing protein n=1 Tax=Pseudobacter ginsenosidimutans TaxID=661488 RepID=A0A4V2EZM8_9BACT|nr:DUF6249 domain-containing protein [Pseudobacter ginsenosidimutans]QEC45504.1 hypothetical protein FSB84_28840 [Pseudobacter ginsenosidimutans]RZS67040.1 hypothetical protein EV199_5424 [Pseudobacter ginsenosidimutans]
MESTLVPVVLFLSMFGCLFGIVYMWRKENLAMIEKGLNPKDYRPAPYKNLKWGLLLVGAGLGLFLAFLLQHSGMFKLNAYEDEYVPLYFALIGIFGGLGLVISYRIEKKETLDNRSNN